MSQSCMNCSGIGSISPTICPSSADLGNGIRSCFYLGCGVTLRPTTHGPKGFTYDHEAAKAFAHHERAHYKVGDRYYCLEPHCSATFGSWMDLRRHTNVRHCTTVQRFPCDVPGCKYGGTNGFKRKDKLRDHVKNVHRAGNTNVKRNPMLAPALAKGHNA